MLKKTQWIVILIVFTAVIFFVMGYVFSVLKNNISVNPKNFSLNTGANTYQAGWDAAKKRLSDSGVYPSTAANVEMKSIMGEVKGINGDKITLKIRPLEPLADQSLDERTVTVDSNTKIYSLEPKDQKEFTAEMDAYNKKMKASVAQVVSSSVNSTSTTPVVPTTPVAPPESFKKNVISITDLKVGQTINVSSEKDIKEVKEFNALEISYYQPSTTTAPIMTPAVPVKK